MKPIIMFVTEWCPYCKKALNWMEDVKKQNPEYSNIEIKIIDEELQPDIAKEYTYYYVPTYYVDGVKVHEGVASKDIINKILKQSMEQQIT